MIRNSALSGHRLSEALFCKQAQMMNMDLMREDVVASNGYIHHFDRAVNTLKDMGYDGGIFGDIYLVPHREWIEKQCDRLGIEAIFPLWGMDVDEIYREFVESGFGAKIIGAAKEYRDILGCELTMELYDDLKKRTNFDICGENGEYHTFVTRSPLYKSDIEYRIVEHFENEKLHGITLDIK